MLSAEDYLSGEPRPTEVRGKIGLTCRRPECHPQRCLITGKCWVPTVWKSLLSLISNIGQLKGKILQLPLQTEKARFLVHVEWRDFESNCTMVIYTSWGTGYICLHEWYTCCFLSIYGYTFEKKKLIGNTNIYSW